MDDSLLLKWINDVYDINNKTRQRSAVIISGDICFCEETVNFFIDQLPYKTVFKSSSFNEKSIATKKSRIELGQEYDALIFDACAGFDIDAFGAVSGTVKEKGMIFLMLPDTNQSDNYISDSRFLTRALDEVSIFKNIYMLNQVGKLPDIDNNDQVIVSRNTQKSIYRTPDQKQAVEAIVTHLSNENKTAIVLTSNRGRGKSSALGFAAGLLLNNDFRKIIITSPRKKNSEIVFYHANTVLESKDSGGELIFMAPDSLLEISPDADAIFIDEASAIPLPMLEKILKLYPKTVFASTIHGYEGTGRGFVLKFNQMLDALSSGWHKYEMETPIRWIKNDPVEKWVDSMLCLNVELDRVNELIEFNINDCHVTCVDRDALVRDDAKTQSLFALLIYAHYRTQPSDLAYMLDADLIRIYTLEFNNKILATALVSEEGGFDGDLSAEIYKGKRRPKGHLLAQTLCFHAGVEYAATLKYARVMRIAVHPELQRQGLGSHLLDVIIEREKILCMDAIGSSFGSTAELMKFWGNQRFELVRMGFSRDHASGTHSAVMLRSLHARSEAVFTELRTKFSSYIHLWLRDSLVDMSSDMKQYLHNEYVDNGSELTDYELRDINSFAFYHRGYEVCMPALAKLVSIYSDSVSQLNDIQRLLIKLKIQQNDSWSNTVKESDMAGKKSALLALRSAVACLLKIINV